MKFTVALLGLLAISSVFAEKKESEVEPKDKREAPVGYHGGSGGGGHSSHVQIQPSYSQGDSNAISIGAGYHVGAGKSALSYGGSPSYKIASLSDGSQGGHQTYRLSPITLQPSGSDLAFLMSSIAGAHGLPESSIGHGGSGAVQSALYASPHSGLSGLSGLGGHSFGIPQAAYSSSKLAPITLNLQSGHSSSPAYAAGHQGLSAYASGSHSTGPVLFSPASSGSSSGQTYAVPSFASSGHGSHYAFAAPTSSHSFDDLSSFSAGNAEHSFGGSLGGLKGYAAPQATISFKPSAYLGSSSQGDIHGLSGLSAGYGAPSSHGFAGSAGHGYSVDEHSGSLGQGASFGHGASLGQGASFGHGASLGQGLGGHTLSLAGLSASLGGHGLSLGGSGGHGSFGGSLGHGTKYVAASYLPPASSHGGQSYSGHSLGSSGLSSSGHYSSPPSTTYGHPSSSSGHSSSHASPSTHQYFISKGSKHGHSSPYSSGSSPYSSGSSAYSSPHSGRSSLSSGYEGSSFGHGSSAYSPRDTHGAHSETSYNTIKYSAELKPKH